MSGCAAGTGCWTRGLQRARELFGTLGATARERRAASELPAAGEAVDTSRPARAEQYGLPPREATGSSPGPQSFHKDW
ncbi:hypothetical protein GCM10010300_81610 [Streptomyces olivaceoviridis]|uniref:hypothetical protein n=1 Tax=Streptomyces olivaceoviridis TaxID=1921 RepID=UPI0019A2A8C2|nr:hypothetical protein [Streptomyces olivaceoviridis]GGZ25937.1 hypothetical protein GCM10010300_81610 [Streptomyces olivaceoviridis]